MCLLNTSVVNWAWAVHPPVWWWPPVANLFPRPAETNRLYPRGTHWGETMGARTCLQTSPKCYLSSSILFIHVTVFIAYCISCTNTHIILKQILQAWQRNIQWICPVTMLGLFITEYMCLTLWRRAGVILFEQHP